MNEKRHSQREQQRNKSSDQAYRLLGLARRAGRVMSGTEAVLRVIQQRQARLVMVASDAADRTCREMTRLTDTYQVPMVVFGTKKRLGHWVGVSNRAVIAIMNTHFALRLKDLTEQAKDGMNHEQGLDTKKG